MLILVSLSNDWLKKHMWPGFRIYQRLNSPHISILSILFCLIASSLFRWFTLSTCMLLYLSSQNFHSPKPSVNFQRASKYLSYIGCGLSIVSLIMTLAVYVLSPWVSINVIIYYNSNLLYRYFIKLLKYCIDHQYQIKTAQVQIRSIFQSNWSVSVIDERHVC